MKKYKLVIITVTYNPNVKELNLFINSYYKYNDLGDNAKLIIVDNSPTDSWGRSEFAQRYNDIEFIPNPSNPGFGASNNIGFKKYLSEYTLFINNDVEFLEPLFKLLIKEFEKDNQELYKSGWRSQFLSGLMHPLMNFVGNVGYVAVAILGGYFAVKGRITVGNIQSFIQYNKQFTQPIGQVAQISSTIQSMLAAAERIFEFLEEKEEVEDVKNPLSTDGLKGNIKFEHVHFGYDPEKTIINDFNADVKDGQKIAIVGPTGAGKTTMVKLLMRFYDVNSGAILLDGHNIKEFKRGELRKMFGMVLQDTWLFGGTIKENIKYSKPDATDSEVIEAAKAAHVHHYIKTLSKGYDAKINEESTNISAGQKQLLTIARVILANPKILILDEATSSIDTRTEQQIQSAMDNLMEGRTSFIIAHRLSTIKNADLILVMDHGDIVEQGNHEELLAKDGFYAKLYNSQFEDCNDEVE